MSLDDAAYPALWNITSQTGIKPEWLLPVLWLESGFNPAVPNQAGQPFYGLNQASVSLIQTYAGVSPDVYLTWSASQQLNTVVLGYLKGLVSSYGPLRSATRCYQANFLPGTLNTARKLGDVITSSPSAFYNANAGLDVNHDGSITVGDLAANMARVARTPQVQSAIKTAYAAKDSATGFGSSDPTDVNEIVYGEDFNFYDRNRPWIIGGAILFGAAAVSYYIHSAMGPTRKRLRSNPSESTQIQTLLFDRAKWSKAEAKAWALDHNFTARKTHVTANYIRIRQAPPGRFKTLRTKTLSDKQGIKAVIGR
jgi:hypothetical protein